MTELQWEVAAAMFAFAVVGLLMWVGIRQGARRQRGWCLLLAGFSAHGVGMALDALVIFMGPNPDAPMLFSVSAPIWEKLLGHVLGLILISTGLILYMKDLRNATRHAWEQQHRFRVLTDASPFGMVAIDPLGKFSYVNPTFIRMFGYHVEEIVDGKGWFNLAYPDPEYRREVIRTWLDDMVAVAAGQPRPRLFTVRCKDGTDKIIHFTAVQLEYGRHLLMCEDVTLRMQAEEALKRSEERYRLVFENAREGIILVQDGRIRFANPSALHTSGFSQEEVLSKSFVELLVPDDREAMTQRYMKRLQGEQAPSRYQVRIMGAQRQVIWLEVDPVLVSWEGKPATLVFARDIAAIRLTEEALQESQARLNLAIEGAELGLWDLNIFTETLVFNTYACRIRGYPLEACSLDRKTWNASIHPDDLPYVLASFDAHLAGLTQFYEAEYRLSVGPDTEKWVLARGRVVERDRDGNPLRITGTLLDITDRKWTESLMRAQRDLSIGLSTVSDLQAALDLFMHTALKLSRMDCAGVYLATRIGGFKAAAHLGFSEASAKGRTYLDPGSPETLAMYEGKPIYSTYRESAARFVFGSDAEHLKAVAVLPMFHDARVIASLHLGSRILDEVPVRTRRALEALADQIGSAIARLKAEDAMRRARQRFEDLAALLPQFVFEIDSRGKLTFINQAAASMTEYTIEDFNRGLNVLTLFKQEDVERLASNIRRVLSGEHFAANEYAMIRKDGSTIPVIVYSSPIRRGDRIEGIRGVCVDITGRKKAEQETRDSLKEKETLLREIHHRVKNNLQVISSMLALQASYVRESQYRKVFKDMEKRAWSMALVHENLYRSENLSRLKTAAYICTLVRHLAAAYRTDDQRIRVDTDIEDISLELDTAIPCALIVNELFANALEHAFPGDRTGFVRVSLCRLGELELALTVKDDGVGMPAHVDLAAPMSFGLDLVSTLVDQLHGEIQVDASHGTEFRIRLQERRAAGSGNQ